MRDMLKKIYAQYSRYMTLKIFNRLLAGFVVVLGVSALYVIAIPKTKISQQNEIEAVENSYVPPEEHQDDIKTQELARNVQMQSYGDWGVECVAVFGDDQECHLLQRILWDDTKEEAMLAHILFIEKEGQVLPRLRLIAPLGTFLPAGMQMKLGDINEIYAPFQYCMTSGCFVNLDLAQDVVEEMGKHKILYATYQQADGGVGKVEISLNGLPAGLLALKDLNRPAL